MTTNIDFSKAHKHPDYPGVAWAIEGYNIERAPVMLDPDDELSGVYYDESEEVEDVTQVRCHMIGDDRTFLFDTEDMIELDDEEYCSSCGQVGCSWGH